MTAAHQRRQRIEQQIARLEQELSDHVQGAEWCVGRLFDLYREGKLTVDVAVVLTKYGEIIMNCGEIMEG